MGACWSKDIGSGLNQFNNPLVAGRRLSMTQRVQDNGKSFVQKYVSRTPSSINEKRNSFDKFPDTLFKRVLEQLPTSSLVQMRCVCKKWNDFILSCEITPRIFTAKSVLFNFSAAELTARIYSPRATHWELEKKSLSFLLETRIGDVADAVSWAPTFGSRWLRLVASGGGLLCFSSSSYFWAFIVCNPLTKKWRRLQMPFANGQRDDHHSMENCMPPPPWAVKLWNSKNRVIDWQAKLDEELAVCIIVDSDNPERGSYKLIVAGLYEGSLRTTLVYNSTTAAWRKIASVPVMQSKDSRFCSRAIACNGHMYCLTGEFQDRYAILRRPTRLLKCDMQTETWSEVQLLTELGFPNDLVEHCGRILLLTHDRYNIGNSLNFHELREFDAELSFSPTDLIPNMITVWLNDCRKQSNFHFSVRCLGNRNVMYISTKMDKDHKVLAYNVADKTCTTTRCPKNADYIYDAGWQVFSPALHAAV